ncbi:11307_t:CDS:2 [Paraglomus brasilianum]|uniref:11307_t:CDS:1 n=1 Tax=Paraglomus brasilianum TaxID=144538 RepID=A0A9N9BC16_9GLOM|nr:11307_t:CDS:2 [Paraglomus brasilianum]
MSSECTSNLLNSPSSRQITSRSVKQSLRPVTIGQIMKAEEYDKTLLIDEEEVSQIKLIANVCSVGVNASCTTYILGDGTGTIKAKEWHADDESAFKERIMVNTYVQIFGNLKATETERYVSIFQTRPVTDYNELTHHYLEVLSVHLSITRGSLPPPQQALPSSSFSGQSETSSLSYLPYGMYSNNVPILNNDEGFVSPLHKEIRRLVRQWANTRNGLGESDDGMEINELVLRLQSTYGRDTVRDGVQWLINEGHLYTTMDEEHVRITE